MAGSTHTPVRLLQVTDPHLFGDESQTIYGVTTAVSFHKVLAEAFAPGTARPDAVLVTGDIADDHTAAAYANFRRALQPYGLPVYCLPGNHDEPGLMTGLVNSDGFQYGGTAEFGAWSAVFIDTHVHGRPDFVNLLVGSASAKWALIGAIMVPMLMQLGVSPDLTQAAYRIGDSSTNIITPLLPFFPLIVVFCRRYVKNSGIGTLVALMLPYSIALLVTWTALLLAFWGLGIPLGVGSSYGYVLPGGAG